VKTSGLIHSELISIADYQTLG